MNIFVDKMIYNNLNNYIKEQLYFLYQDIQNSE